MTKTYKQYARQAVRSAKKAEEMLMEMGDFMLPPEEEQEVKDALGATRVLLHALGNIQHDAECGDS